MKIVADSRVRDAFFFGDVFNIDSAGSDVRAEARTLQSNACSKQKRLTFGVSLFEYVERVSGSLRMVAIYFFFGAAFVVPFLPPVAGLETERRVAASLALNG